MQVATCLAIATELHPKSLLSANSLFSHSPLLLRVSRVGLLCRLLLLVVGSLLLQLGIRRQNHLAVLAELFRGRVNDSVLTDCLDDSLNQLFTKLGMAHLTTAISKKNLYFITFLQKFNRVVDFCIKIIVIDMKMKLHFLDFLHNLVLFCIALPLVFLVLVFAEIHDAANWRLSLRVHFDQIKACVVGLLNGFLERDDPQLLVVLGN